jgi:hypothetical protein
MSQSTSKCSHSDVARRWYKVMKGELQWVSMTTQTFTPSPYFCIPISNYNDRECACDATPRHSCISVCFTLLIWSYTLIHCSHIFCCSSQLCTYYIMSLLFLASVIMFTKCIIYMSALILLNLSYITSMCTSLKYFVIAHLKTISYTICRYIHYQPTYQISNS